MDPQIREFTSQLRRLVDRSGMSVASIADRTGYSKSSWERYLGGRLLPPRGAARALANVTDTDIRHLETMWELAERAWSRAEMRHDQTMEAIRVAQAREALGEFWDEPAKGRKRGRTKGGAKNSSKSAGRTGEKNAARSGSKDDASSKTGDGAGSADGSGNGIRNGLKGGSGNKAAGAEPKASSAGTHAPPSTAEVLDDSTAVLRPVPGTAKSPRGLQQQRVDVSSWGSATSAPRTGASSAARAAGRTGASPSAAPATPKPPPSPEPREYPGHPGQGASAPGPAVPDGPADEGRSSRGRRVGALIGGAVGAFGLIAVAVVVFGLPGTSGNSSAAPTPSASAPARDLPAGVKCQGKDCSGEDPEEMGCGGQNVKSSNSAFVGPSVVEVRYSKVCKAAWGRITGAAQGDGLKISAGGHVESDKVDATNDAYTEMVPVSSATEARACATLAAGTTGCTKAQTAAEAGLSEGSADAGASDGSGSSAADRSVPPSSAPRP